MAKPGLPHYWLAQPGFGQELSWLNPVCLTAGPANSALHGTCHVEGRVASLLVCPARVWPRALLAKPGLPHCLWAQLPFPMALAMRKAGLPHCWPAQLGFRMALAIGKPCLSSAWPRPVGARIRQATLGRVPAALPSPGPGREGGAVRGGPLAPPTSQFSHPF